MTEEELDLADRDLRSLLSTCEAVLSGSSLSAGRTTPMTHRVAALRTALELVREAREGA